MMSSESPDKSNATTQEEMTMGLRTPPSVIASISPSSDQVAKQFWRPIMASYCEPYFAAMKIWCDSESSELVVNRIRILENIAFILNSEEYNYNLETSYHFDAEVENKDEATLLPEVIPLGGKEFEPGDDLTAFENTKKRYPSQFFKYGGLFFQNTLMLPLAGNTLEKCHTSNMETRETLLALVSKLFRLPVQSGLAKIVFYPKKSPIERQEYLESHPSQYGNQFLSLFTPPHGAIGTKVCVEAKSGEATTSTFMNGTITEVSFVSEGKKTTLIYKGNFEDGASLNLNENDYQKALTLYKENNVEWTENHINVGAKVAQLFMVAEKELGNYSMASMMSPLKKCKNPNKEVQIHCIGDVKRYAPPSSPSSNDHLYHIVWEDGDEQDYDEGEFQAGVMLFNSLPVLK